MLQLKVSGVASFRLRPGTVRFWQHHVPRSLGKSLYRSTTTRTTSSKLTEDASVTGALKKIIWGKVSNSEADVKMTPDATTERNTLPPKEILSVHSKDIRSLVRDEVRVQLKQTQIPEVTQCQNEQIPQSQTPLANEEPEILSSEEQEFQKAILLGDTVKNAYTGKLPACTLFGRRLQSAGLGFPKKEEQLWLNTSHPSAIQIFGSPSSGKSHTFSSILENFMIPTQTLGTMTKPATAIAFNFSPVTSLTAFRPSEAAYLSLSARGPGGDFIPTTVLAAVPNLEWAKKAYAKFPNVTVKPYLLPPHQLADSAVLTLMGINPNQASPPLYITQVHGILQEMRKNQGVFNPQNFRQMIDQLGLKLNIRNLLLQRVQVMEQYLDLKPGAGNGAFGFEEGTLTILDLSSGADDKETALTSLIIALEALLSSGKPNCVVALDEAHKYLDGGGASTRLVSTLRRYMRERRHTGSRFIIATQEPSIDPSLMGLCDMTVMHNFTSPTWFNAIKRHIAISNTAAMDNTLLKMITRLKTGEALLYAPSAKLGERRMGTGELWSGLVKVKVRERVTTDGGRSIIA